jgi:hypothetical protein
MSPFFGFAPSCGFQIARAISRGRAACLAVAVSTVVMVVPDVANTATVEVHRNGPVDVSVDVVDNVEQPTCSSNPCLFTAPAGTLLTVTATPRSGGPWVATFAGWSDDRCPSGPVCTIPIDADHVSLTANGSPQYIGITLPLSSTGTVTGTPGGMVCEDLPENGNQQCRFEVPFLSNVAFTPHGPAPVWNGCDAIAGDVCHVTASHTRWLALGFGADQPTSPPPNVYVRFRVVKTGSGSGAVRSDSLDCGRRCEADVEFGARETLIAEPDSGSRFVRWHPACAAATRCSLAVGPVTRLTAVFDAVGTGGPSDPSTRPNEPPSSGRGTAPERRMTARLLRVVVRGRGLARQILIRLRIDRTVTVSARLMSRRRQLAGRRWRVRAGQPLLRLRVPRRVRPGAYRVRLVVRDSSGNTRRLAQTLRIGR